MVVSLYHSSGSGSTYGIHLVCFANAAVVTLQSRMAVRFVHLDTKRFNGVKIGTAEENP